jgi:1,3-beta-glucanosyltransferase GAS3
VREILLDTWNYLQCTTGSDASDPSRVDLFALNSYSWCGDSSFQTAGYDVLVSDFSNTSVPVFFSEYGCNKPTPRIFTEVPVLYGPQMAPVLSGGLVYEFSEEPSDYGLVTINTDGSAKLLSDYDSLQKQYNTLNITALQSEPAQNTTVTPPQCSSSLITNQGFATNFTIPSPPDGAEDLINNGIKNAPVGKIVTVSNTKVTQQVQGSDGQAITNLAISPLKDDQSNTPSGQTPSSSTTSSAPAATTSKKSGAATLQASLGALLGVGFLVVVLL